MNAVVLTDSEVEALAMCRDFHSMNPVDGSEDDQIVSAINGVLTRAFGPDEPGPPAPLTDSEKAYFDAIKQVARSARPGDLSLSRMTLDGRPVAVVVQTVIDSGTAEALGVQPLALICDEEVADRLRDVDGRAAELVDPSGAEGAA